MTRFDAPLSRATARRLMRRHYAAAAAETTVQLLDSRSMAPLIAGSCTMLIRWLPDDQRAQPGELILAGWDDLLLVHRVVDVHADGESAGNSATSVEYLQMADNLDFNNPFAASWLPAEDVFGVVRAVTASDDTTLYRANDRICRFADAFAARTGRLLRRAHHRRSAWVETCVHRFRTAAFSCLAVLVHARFRIARRPKSTRAKGAP